MGIKDFVVVIMEVLKFGFDVWWECIFWVKVYVGVVLEVISSVIWLRGWFIGGC